MAAKANDDFGIERLGLSYELSGSEPVDIELASKTDEKSHAFPKAANLEQLVAMESLKAEPDQLLSYYVWAEDRDEAGEIRRVSSDMFFAEVRPFEEIFRQGEQESQEQQQRQQQQQQQQQQGGQSEEVLELQKQIVTGTWNVLRTARKGELSEKAGEDVGVLAESQTAAIELLAEKAAEINVPGAEQLVAAATGHMERAQAELEAAAASRQSKDLKKALSSAQSAYQSLLRLQAREFEVTRGQQQSGQQQRQSSRSRQRQQQLDQLKLENREDRYESERTAQEEQQQEKANCDKFKVDCANWLHDKKT